MKNYLRIIVLCMICVTIISCEKDSTTDQVPDSDQVSDSDSGSDSEISMTKVDTQLFEQIKMMGDIFSGEEVWKGYPFKETPMYLIHKDSDGKVDKGFVINPMSEISEATRVNGSNNGGIIVYQYNKQMQAALDLLNSDNGNGLYDFNYEIDGNKSYYLQVYTDAEVKQGEKPSANPGGTIPTPEQIVNYTVSAIDFITHEVFHEYQISSWSNKNALSNTVSKEILELRALTHQIFKDFPNQTDVTVLEDKLRQYVAIKTKERTTTGFITNVERSEGTARYIERMAARKVFPARVNESFVLGTIIENNYEIKSKEDLTDIIVDLGYETGASALYALIKMGVDPFKDIENGKSVFDLAEAFFDMTPQELDVQLEEAKKSADWPAIQNKAEEWSKLN